MPRARSTSQLAAMFAIAACAAIAPACWFDESASQCETDQDCQARGPAFDGTRCGDDHTCHTGGGPLGPSGCKSNAQCLAAFKDGPAFCRRPDHKCQPVTSIDCQRLLNHLDRDDLRDDSTVILGAACDLSGPDALSSGINLCNGIALAVGEVRAQGGLPPLTPGGPRRPLVVVACDDHRRSQPGLPTLNDALKHLVNTVQVPVILGTSSSASDRVAITDFAVRTNTLFIGHSAQSSQLGLIPARSTEAPVGTRLYYRSAASDQQHIATMLRSIPDYFEPSLKAPGGPLQAGQPLKVMIVLRRDAENITARSVINGTIAFNGKTAVANGDDFRSIQYDLFDDADSDGAAATAEVVQAVTAYKPHVLVLQGLDEIYKAFIPRIEKAWTETTYKPRLLIGASGAQTPLLLSAIANNDDLRRRTFGFSTRPVAQASPSYVAFQQRYAAAFPDAAKDGVANNFAAQGYDAAWLAFYALAAHADAGGLPLTGSSIASFVPRLLPGPGRPKVDVGAAGMAAGLAALGTGLDLVGASGPLDLDVATGTAEQDVDMWYCTADAAGKASGFASSGYHYSAAQKQIVGTPTVH